MTEENENRFFQNLDELGTGERAALRREAGIMIQNADGAALRAFYSCLPHMLRPYEEEIWFSVACFYCLWEKGESNGEPLEKVISLLMKKEKVSESILHRVEALLDTKWDSDGYMLSKLCRMVKMIRQKSNQTRIDFKSLRKDLSGWNHDSQYVQRKWARTIFGNETDDKEEKE